MVTSSLVLSAVLSLSLTPGATFPGTGDLIETRSCSAVRGTEVCTWIVLDDDRVVQLGASIPMALVEAVPDEAPMVWPPEQLGFVPLPPAARERLGLDHLGINWEANGHPPQTYLAQHFDFHFYGVTPEAVAAIDCSSDAKPGRVPTDYVLPDIEVPGLGTLRGLCVPAMGMHAMPGHELHAAEPFDATIMIGYYEGEPIFFEPMVSRDVLMRRADFTGAIPEVAGLPPGVHYPTSFRAEYDDAKQEYRLIFEGFEGA